jgi:hypothetical protein
VPEHSAPPRPQRTKPRAKPAHVGQKVQLAKPAAVSRAPTAYSRRRDHVSAQAPDGISAVNDTTDQSTNSAEICPVDNPVSAKSRA